MSEEGLDPRDAVLEVLLDGGIDPARRDELRTIIERDPGAAAELAEFERIDDLLRTAGPMLEPSDDLFTRVLAIPDEVQAEADPGWNLVGRRRARCHAARGRDVDVRPRRAVGRVRGRGRRGAPVAARRPGATAPAPHDAAPAARRARQLPAQHRGLARRGGGLRGGGADPRRHGRHRRRQHRDAGRGRDRHADGHNAGRRETSDRPERGSAGERARASRRRIARRRPGVGRGPGRSTSSIDGLPNTPKRVYTVLDRAEPADGRIALGTFRADADGKLDVDRHGAEAAARRSRTSGSRASRRRARRAGRPTGSSRAHLGPVLPARPVTRGRAGSRAADEL